MIVTSVLRPPLANSFQYVEVYSHRMVRVARVDRVQEPPVVMENAHAHQSTVKPRRGVITGRHPGVPGQGVPPVFRLSDRGASHQHELDAAAYRLRHANRVHVRVAQEVRSLAYRAGAIAKQGFHARASPALAKAEG